MSINRIFDAIGKVLFDPECFRSQLRKIKPEHLDTIVTVAAIIGLVAGIAVGWSAVPLGSVNVLTGGLATGIIVFNLVTIVLFAANAVRTYLNEQEEKKQLQDDQTNNNHLIKHD